MRHVESIATPNVFEVGPDGTPVENRLSNTVGSVDGLFLDQDRIVVLLELLGRAVPTQLRAEAVETA